MVTRADAELRLARATWLRREETQRIFRLLDGAAGRTRAVGGIVRDTLLDRERTSTDIDLATELVPKEVMRRAMEAGISAYPTGIEHGTVTLKAGDLLAEVTTLRLDVETDGRRAVVRFGTDWERDAERRDFTLNALYADMDGGLLDPLGGLEDCLAGRVRFIGDPERRIAEDRLRVYRFFRFSASHGEQRFDADGLTACRLAVSTLGRLSAERVGAEMKRMLGLPKVALTVQAMVVAGVLSLSADVMRLMTSYEQRAVAPSLAGRLAIVVSGADAKSVQTRWRLSNAEIGAAEAVLAAEAMLAENRINEAAYRHPGALADAICLGAIRHHWGEEAVAHMRATIANLRVPSFPVSGRDLLGLGFRSGEALGRELSRLEHAWIASGFALGRTELLAGVEPPR
jgi:poly(A) polymerase